MHVRVIGALRSGRFSFVARPALWRSEVIYMNSLLEVEVQLPSRAQHYEIRGPQSGGQPPDTGHRSVSDGGFPYDRRVNDHGLNPWLKAQVLYSTP